MKELVEDSIYSEHQTQKENSLSSALGTKQILFQILQSFMHACDVYGFKRAKEIWSKNCREEDFNRQNMFSKAVQMEKDSASRSTQASAPQYSLGIQTFFRIYRYTSLDGHAFHKMYLSRPYPQIRKA